MIKRLGYKIVDIPNKISVQISCKDLISNIWLDIAFEMRYTPSSLWAGRDLQAEWQIAADFRVTELLF